MTKVTVELEVEQIDAIILQEMKWQYEYCLDEIERLKSLGDEIRTFEKEDLASHEKTRDASEHMIRYYSFHDEAEAYFKSLQKYEDDEGENYVMNTDHD